MAEWISCGRGFIAADVVKWREGIWDKRGPGKGRVIRVGDRLMIAEVLEEADEEGWCLLLVRECVVLESTLKRDKAAVKRGDEITRREATILKGKPQRMLWSDEEARALVTGSKFHRRKTVSPDRKRDLDDS